MQKVSINIGCAASFVLLFFDHLKRFDKNTVPFQTVFKGQGFILGNLFDIFFNSVPNINFPPKMIILYNVYP